jgi:hypothetical protein
VAGRSKKTSGSRTRSWRWRRDILIDKRLNELLEGAGFDELVEGLCARFYHARLGRPSLRPGIYF